MTNVVRVITTCTSRKLLRAIDEPTDVLPGLSSGAATVSAERLYTGEQHRRLMTGVRALRARRTVEVWVVSARAGLVSGTDKLGAYDDSFARLSHHEVRALADRLAIATEVRALLATPAAGTIVLAGNEYFDAARLDEPVDWASPTLLLVSPSRAAQVPEHPQLQVVPVSQALAKAWSLPLTLLKGELAGRLLHAIAAGTLTPRRLQSDDVMRIVHRSESQRIAS